MSNKPLGGKAYGSIPHLPGSRVGPGDHHCHEGQAAICWTKTRDKHDRVIVTEKLDGSNVAIARIDNQIYPLMRAGHLANTSPYGQHHAFYAWVLANASRWLSALKNGERFNGEWLAVAHGTFYHLLHEPFVIFDSQGPQGRLPWDETIIKAGHANATTAQVLHDGGAVDLDVILPKLDSSAHGAVDPVEGAVWRVERDGQFDFMAKWVRPDKVDGKYLSGLHGNDNDLWNMISPSAIAKDNWIRAITYKPLEV